MPIFRKHFDCILHKSKLVYVIALEWSLMLGIQIIAQMHITVNLFI